MPRRKPPDEEDRFLSGIAEAPEDDSLRLVYADWLEDRGDARAAYLRAEVGHFRSARRIWAEWPEWMTTPGIDPIWAALVSRAPYGINVAGLTFTQTGPRITRADIEAIEQHWGCPLLPDYAAFLLRHNGGRPSRPYLYAAEAIEFMPREYQESEAYSEVHFFSTKEKGTDGHPYQQLIALHLHLGEVEEDDIDAFMGMMPIATLKNEGAEKGEERFLVLVMNADEFDRILELVYTEKRGLIRTDDGHASPNFASLLGKLCDYPNGE